jgi:hypothetical protein
LLLLRNGITSVFESDSDGDGLLNYRQETLYEYLDGSESVMGVSTKLEVFSDRSLDFQVDPLSEDLTLSFSVAADVM